MRISTGLFSRNFLLNIQKLQEEIFWNNQRIATAKRLQKPSDDPIGTSMAIELRNNIRENEQYIKNTEDAIAWLNSTHIAVDHFINLLSRAQEIGVYAASDTISAEERKTLGEEINQILEEFVATANTKIKGKYIFGGFQTLSPTYIPERDPTTNLIIDVDPNPAGISGEIKRKIAEAEEITINTLGTEIFTLPVAGIDTFDALINFRDALYNNDPTAIQSARIQIDEAMRIMRMGIEKIGAKSGRLFYHRPELDNLLIARKGELSKVEDTDMAKEIVELEKNKTALHAALQIGARIMELSLLNFI